MQACMQMAQKAPEIETKTRVVPTHEIILKESYFQNGNLIRQRSQTIDYIYGTESATVTKTAKMRRQDIHERIILETLQKCQELLATGAEVPALSRRGRAVAQIRLPQHAALPKSNDLEQKTPLKTPTFIGAAQNLAPLAFIGVTSNALASLVAGKKTDLEKRQEKDLKEEKKREEALQALKEERAKIDAQIAALNSPNQAALKTTLAAQNSALSSAASSTQTEIVQQALSQSHELGATVQSAQNNNSSLTINEKEPVTFAEPTTTALYLKHSQEGGLGTFKGLILEAITQSAPSEEAQATFVSLSSTPLGKEIIQEVLSDLNTSDLDIGTNHNIDIDAQINLENSEILLQTNEHAFEQHTATRSEQPNADTFEHYLDQSPDKDNQLDGASFSMYLRSYRPEEPEIAAPKLALAA